jgi:ubiquinone/menaquinone biosynthesis C-methylase UbiE
MTVSEPNQSKTIFASGDVAKQWQRGKAFRDDVNAGANEIMLDLANLVPGNRVLDVAAGTGDQTLLAAQRVGPTGYVLATDLSTSMLNLAADAARDAGLKNVETRQMDAENIDLDAGSFDAVIYRMGLMLFSDPIKALIGMHRVLKPIGKAVALVWAAQEKNPCRGIPLTVFRRLGGDFSAAPGLDLMFRLGDRAILEDTFKAGGFQEVAVHAVATRWGFSSVADAVQAAKDSSPGLQRILAPLSDTERDLAWTQVEQEFSKFGHANGFEAPGEVLIGVGNK